MRPVAVKADRRGLKNLSTLRSARTPRSSTGRNFALSSWRSARLFGSHGKVFSVTAMPISTMPAPNTVDTPGIDTGNRKGRDNRPHSSSKPFSPIPASSWRRVTYSSLMETITSSSSSLVLRVVSLKPIAGFIEGAVLITSARRGWFRGALRSKRRAIRVRLYLSSSTGDKSGQQVQQFFLGPAQTHAFRGGDDGAVHQDRMFDHRV